MNYEKKLGVQKKILKKLIQIKLEEKKEWLMPIIKKTFLCGVPQLEMALFEYL